MRPAAAPPVDQQVLGFLGARPAGLSEKLLYELIDFDTLQNRRRPDNGGSSKQLQHILSRLASKKRIVADGPDRWRLP